MLETQHLGRYTGVRCDTINVMNITRIEADWIQESIEKVEFLNILDPRQILSLTHHVTPQLFQGEELIIEEGQPGQSFFFIYNGRVSVFVERNGKKTKLATLKRGDFFGEISLLTGQPTTAHVMALGPTKVFFIDNNLFLSFIRANQKFADHVTEVMKKRLEERKEALQTYQYANLEELNQAIKDFLKPREDEKPEKKDETKS